MARFTGSVETGALSLRSLTVITRIPGIIPPKQRGGRVSAPYPSRLSAIVSRPVLGMLWAEVDHVDGVAGVAVRVVGARSRRRTLPRPPGDWPDTPRRADAYARPACSIPWAPAQAHTRREPPGHPHQLRVVQQLITVIVQTPSPHPEPTGVVPQRVTELAGPRLLLQWLARGVALVLLTIWYALA